VLWHFESDEAGKTTKIPCQTTGTKASSTNPNTWISCDTGLAVWRTVPGRFNGIGFVFVRDNGLTGGDLDNSLDEQGNLKPWAAEIFVPFKGTYAEVSPSGKGIKFIVRGRLEGSGKRVPWGDGAIELYDRAHYFTITSNSFDGAPPEIKDCQAELTALYRRLSGVKGSNSKLEKEPLVVGSRVPQGRRRPTLISLAGTMLARGMSQEAITAALLAENAERFDPPLSEEEVRAQVSRFCTRCVARESSDVAPPAGADYRTLFERTIMERNEIVESLLYEGQLAALVGDYGLGKSPLCQDLAIHIAAGRNWCGREVRRRPIVYVDLENPNDVLKNNLVRLCNRLGIPYPPAEEFDAYLMHDSIEAGNTYLLLAALRRPPEERISFLHECLERRPEAVLVLDPWEVFFSINKNYGDKVLAVNYQLRDLLSKFPAAAVMMLFNIRKKDQRMEDPDLLGNPRGFLQEISGSNELLNRADVRLGFDFHPRDREVRVIGGVLRGVGELHPILVRSIGEPPDQLSGYEQVPPESADLAAVLTVQQLDYWHKLWNGTGEVFTWQEARALGIPKSTLWKIMERGKSFGLLAKSGSTKSTEVWAKVRCLAAPPPVSPIPGVPKRRNRP
jgi:hypothetical protein